MARCKPLDRNSLLLPVVLSEQIVPGTFAFALDYLIDNEHNLTALDAQFNNDELGASAYPICAQVQRLEPTKRTHAPGN